MCRISTRQAWGGAWMLCCRVNVHHRNWQAVHGSVSCANVVAVSGGHGCRGTVLMWYRQETWHARFSQSPPFNQHRQASYHACGLTNGPTQQSSWRRHRQVSSLHRVQQLQSHLLCRSCPIITYLSDVMSMAHCTIMSHWGGGDKQK